MSLNQRKLSQDQPTDQWSSFSRDELRFISQPAAAHMSVCL